MRASKTTVVISVLVVLLTVSIIINIYALDGAMYTLRPEPAGVPYSVAIVNAAIYDTRSGDSAIYRKFSNIPKYINLEEALRETT